MASSAKEIPSRCVAIENLVVTQFGYRHDAGVKEMTKYVQHGGVFNCNPRIVLFKLNDDQLYIHDGHHRSMAIYLSGRKHLEEQEYVITPFSFEELSTPNFDVGFVTPYDPRTEMRLSDFRIFKKTALLRYRDFSNPNHEKDAIEYINANRALYRIPHRPYETIPDMVSYLGLDAAVNPINPLSTPKL